jgi:hypothetical protein
VNVDAWRGRARGRAAPLGVAVGDRRDQRVLGLPRVEPGVLDDDRDVGDDHARVVGVAGDRLGFVEVVEADVARPSRVDGQAVGPDRLAVGEVDGDLDVGGSSPALRMQAVSWLVISGSGPLLRLGM